MSIKENRVGLRCERPIDTWMGSSAIIYCENKATHVINTHTGNGRPVFPITCEKCGAGYALTPIMEAETISMLGAGDACGWLQN